MQIIVDCLLYFTTFGAILALFISIISILAWLLKTLVILLLVGPQAKKRESNQLDFQGLAHHLRRAGQ